MKIKTKLVLIFLITVIAMAGVYTFFIVPKLMVDELSNISTALDRQVHQLDEVMGNYRTTMKDNLESVIDAYKMTEGSFLLDDEQSINAFNSILAANKQIKFIAHVKGNGECLIADSKSGIRHDDEIDYRNEPWYKKAIETPGQVVFTDILEDSDHKSLNVFGAIALKNGNGSAHHVIGFSMDIGLLQSFIQGMVFNNVGLYGINMGNNTLIIDGDEKPFIGQIPEVNQAIADANNEMEVLSQVKYKGKTYHMASMKSAETPWTYFFMVDYLGAKKLVWEKLGPVLMVSGLTSIIMLIIIMGLFQVLINKPLTHFSRVTSEVADTGDLDLCILTNSKDEIGMMARSFNAMMSEIKSHRNNLNTLVEERTQELTKMMVAIEQSPSQIIITDQSGRVEYANKKALSDVGYTLEELKGMDEFNLVSMQDNPKETIDDLNVSLSKGQGWEGDVIGRSKSGVTNWVHLLVAPIYNDHDEIVNYISISNDISIQKEAEKVLIQAKRNAEEAVQAKSDFLANMSHEIRTPMNAIIGLNSLLSSTELTRRQQDYVTKIGKSANNLLGVINDILDFSKIEAGKLSPEEVEFNLDDVVENISNVVGMKAFTSGLELVIDKDPHIPQWLVGDPLRLGQVLLNITNNAVKFTHKGEILLKISEVASNDIKITLKFEIRDTGIGMSEEQRSKLFSAFMQADSSTTRKFGGTGLGLAISRNLVELMGGNLDVESTQNEGSTFWFTLEFIKGAERHAEFPLLPVDILNLNIVVVDDNEAAIDVYRSCLSEFKNPIKAYQSGVEALEGMMEMAVHQSPDLILMDYKMPDLSGVEVWKEHKARLEGRKEPEIILITAYGREDIIKEAHEAGIKHILMKPVLKPQLISSILQLFSPESLNEIDESKVWGGLQESYGPSESIRGANLLLVEDNEINQQVATEMLENWGFHVSVANDGQEAINLVLKDQRAYDLILMDLQMPVKDGYTAAKEIRQMVSHEVLPILALSADVLEGVGEKVQDAGMQGHIAKPIQPQQLFGEMERWIHLPPERISIKAVSKQVNEEEIEFLRKMLKSVNVEDGMMRIGENMDAYLSLLLRFKENNEDFINEIEAEINADQTVVSEVIQRRIHTLKGVSGNLGLQVLEAQVKVFEKLIREESMTPENLVKHEAFHQLKLDLLQCISEISRLESSAWLTQRKKDKIIEQTLSIDQTISIEEAQNQMDIIIALLKEYDTEVEEKLHEIEGVFAEKELQANYKLLLGRVKNYEFDAAVEVAELLKVQLKK